MANITKKVDKNVKPGRRYQYWKSSENADDGTPIAAGDIFRIAETLGKPAQYLYIETTTGTDLQIRINSQSVSYPPRDATLNWPVPGPDLDNPITRSDTSMAAIPIGADEVWTLKNVMPIYDVQIVAFSTGSFELLVA